MSVRLLFIVLLLSCGTGAFADPPNLAFRAAGEGLYEFDTGALHGRLKMDGKYQGIYPLVDTKSLARTETWCAAFLRSSGSGSARASVVRISFRWFFSAKKPITELSRPPEVISANRTIVESRLKSSNLRCR